MRVLICPSPYKGTISSSQLAAAIETGLTSRYIEAKCVLAPIADGGDGSIDALRVAVGGEVRQTEVVGPLKDRVRAEWLKLGDLAVVELASASGLHHLVGSTLLPLAAHTAGTGWVMGEALKNNVSELVVCVGGSASTDGGSGALSALGAKFYYANGRTLELGGGPLLDLQAVDLQPLSRWNEKCKIKVAVDVSTPLLGLTGAAAIFAPQKGATPSQVQLLEEALTNYADIMEAAAGRQCRNTPGAGAAGGTAFGLACGLGAEIISGFSWLAGFMNLEQKVIDADFVITAEGSLDTQSLVGKATGELAKICLKHKRPLIVLPAVAEQGVDWQSHGIAQVIPTAAQDGIARVQDVERLAALSRLL